MGEATPAQTAAGSFVPMLGVGLGAMQGGGGGGVGGSIGGSARGSAVPQLHNAIVERLRARIELCRRHHSTCESRYQRGQAESSEREHQSTLHLLNIVQQGPGTRKGKAAGGGRGSNLQNPVDYNAGRANGEQKIQEGEHKISTRIAVQGSLRRKLEAHASKQNGLSCGFGGSDFKRVRLEAGALAHGSCNHNLPQSHSLQGSASAAAAAAAAMGLQRKSYMMPHASGSDIFNMTLKEMKKEPVEIQSCGHSSADMIFDFKEEVGGQIDPDLQDLFDELTKTVPPLNDLEFEKMLKQDEAFGLDLGRPSSAGAAAGLCSPLDKPIKTEPSPDFGQVHCGSPQLRPASAGPSFTLTSTSSSSTSQKASSQTGHPRTLPCWPEISHAEQLKQMAANQQQPSALLHHHHHQTPAGGLTSWAPAINAHSSSSSSSSAGAFPQDGVANSPLNQQRIGALSKGMNNCLFKPNGHNGAHHMDMKVLSTKPTLHFSPKAAAAAAGLSASQPISILTRPDQRQQQSPPPPPPPSGPNQPHPSLHFQNQQIPSSGGLCLPHKPVPAGLQFRMSQQRQAVPAAPRMTANGGLMSQPRVSAPTNQQKGPPKAPSMQRPLPQQHAASNAISNAISNAVNNAISNAVSNADKDGSHEQFSRHLTRPPPDYKQSRSLVGVPQGMFSGAPSAPPPSNGLDSGLPSLSCQLRPGSVSKLPASPSERRFGSDCLPSSCAAPFQQQSGHARMGASPQSKPRFLGPPGKSFGLSGVQQHGPPLGAMMSNLGWGAANKQVGLRRLPNPLQSDAGHPYQNRPVAPPNQAAADLGMLPLRDAAPRPGPALLGSPSAAGTLNQASPEQRVPAGGNFSEPGSFQSGRANRLTFDFLPEGDNTVPGINADSDFIDSLLKSGSGNDDWMKDINLDEILGGHS